jgi:hypothetical protein
MTVHKRIDSEATATNQKPTCHTPNGPIREIQGKWGKPPPLGTNARLEAHGPLASDRSLKGNYWGTDTLVAEARASVN